MICCYTLIGNDSARDPLHSEPCRPVEKVSDDAIKQVGATRFNASDSGVTFLEPVGHLRESVAK
jgi:hypothetical protein